MRRSRGEGLKDLADRIPMSPSNLSRVELGRQGPPPSETIEQIATALEVDDPGELLRAANRDTGRSLEQRILDSLEALHEDVREIKDALRK